MSETATPTRNPACHACFGTGIDAAFGTECSECWIDEGRAALIAAAYEGIDTGRPAERPTGNGTGRGRQAPPATDKQLRFIATLADERNVQVHTDGLTKSAASKLIDELLATKPELPNPAPLAHEVMTEVTPDGPRRPAPADHRPNRYGAKCADCGGWVEAQTGSLTKEDGRWVTRHIGGCPEAAPVERNDDRNGYEAKRGDVHFVDGTYYRIHESQRTGRAYAARATIIREAVWGVDENGERELVTPGEIDWDYAKGMIFRLNAETIATAEEAARFGEMVGRCCFCSHAIDTVESTKAGYGPVCARKYDLPWG